MSHLSTKGLSSGGEDLLHETSHRWGYGKATGMPWSKPNPPWRKEDVWCLQKHHPLTHNGFTTEWLY